MTEQSNQEVIQNQLRREQQRQDTVGSPGNITRDRIAIAEATLAHDTTFYTNILTPMRRSQPRATIVTPERRYDQGHEDVAPDPIAVTAILERLSTAVDRFNQAQAQRPHSIKTIKAADLGYFYPNTPITHGASTTVVFEGKTYYRDVYSFCNRLDNLYGIKD